MTAIRKNLLSNPKGVSINTNNLARQLITHIRTLDPDLKRPIITVGIGTDRSTGDSLGPLVGTLLAERLGEKHSLHVFGTLEQPVHAVNIADQLKTIFKEFEDPIIIAVDACLGKSQSIGMINLGVGPIKPGAAVKKELPQVGDLHLTAIVNVGGYLEHLVLQSTRLGLVMNLAKAISDILYFTYWQLQIEALKKVP
jgi:putative sporulation protein YyaC